MKRKGVSASRAPSNLPLATMLAVAVAIAGIALAGPARADDDTEPVKPLRLCADPANLPFSSRNPETPGIHLEIGGAVAKAFKREFQPVWTLTYFGKRSVRTTLLAGQCDYFVGLPNDEDFMGKRVIFTRTIFTVGYALVTPKDARTAILKGQKIGVQFNSGPQNVLAPRNDIETATFLEPEEAMRSLAAKKIDAAVIWAPIASWMNRSQYGSAYRVTPISGPGMQWPAAIGFAAKDKQLRDAVDTRVAGMGEAIKSTLAKYDFPVDAPVELTVEAGSEKAAKKHSEAEPPLKAILVAADSESTGVAKGAASEAIAAGRNTFNGTCAHCHGPNAEQSDRHIDLRLLRHRYGDDMDATFMTTVTNGRPSKGMPTWKGVFTEKQFGEILAWLKTIQAPE